MYDTADICLQPESKHVSLYSQNISRVKILKMYRVGQHSFIILIHTELGLPQQQLGNLFLTLPSKSI